jgi:hypothetical protein
MPSPLLDAEIGCGAMSPQARQLERAGKHFRVPVEHCHIVEVLAEGLPRLRFDDAKQSTLDIHGEFHVKVSGVADVFSPREPGALNVLEAFLCVPIISAFASRHGALSVRFEDGRELVVPDGPYENWHFMNDDGLVVHGGVGRLVW